MTVSRREMAAIAAALRRSKPTGKYTDSMMLVQWTEDVCRVAEALQKLNPKFKPESFAAAVQADG